MTTSVFTDAWAGWTNLVRELVGRRPLQIRVSPPDLKTVRKPPNRATLKRDLTVIRRPQPKRTKADIKEEAALLKREPPEDIPKLQVDPPKPFLLQEEFLETPPERVSRIEKAQKKRSCG